MESKNLTVDKGNPIFYNRIPQEFFKKLGVHPNRKKVELTKTTQMFGESFIITITRKEEEDGYKQ